MNIQQILKKAGSYKYMACKKKFLKREVGVAEGDVISIEGILRIIERFK